MAARGMALAAGSWDTRCPLWGVVALVAAAEATGRAPAYDNPGCQGARRRRGQFSQNDRPAARRHCRAARCWLCLSAIPTAAGKLLSTARKRAPTAGSLLGAIQTAARVGPGSAHQQPSFKRL